MPSIWVDFVNQNKAAESEIARLNVRAPMKAAGTRRPKRSTKAGRCPLPRQWHNLMADWLDNEAIAQRTRDRIKNTFAAVASTDVAGVPEDAQIAARIEALEPPVIKQTRDILLAAKSRADAGQLTLLKTY